MSTEKFMCWNLIPNVKVFRGTDFGKGLDSWESRPLRMGLSFLIKETPKRTLTIWSYSKKIAMNAKSAGALMLDFPTSRTVRTNCLFLISHAACGILLQQPKGTKMPGIWNSQGRAWGRKVGMWRPKSRQGTCWGELCFLISWELKPAQSESLPRTKDSVMKALGALCSHVLPLLFTLSPLTHLDKSHGCADTNRGPEQWAHM